MNKKSILLSKISRFAPLVVWSAIIFFLSSRPSTQLSEDVSENVLYFKSIHIAVYAIMYLLAFYAFNIKYFKNTQLYAFGYAIIFAISDEIHQLFVPTRSGKVSDIFIDLVGIIIAYYIIRVINKSNKTKKVY